MKITLPRLISLVTIAIFSFATVLICTLGLTEKAGWFGDLFGSINALFAGLAFAVVAYSILLQQTQMKQQQEMLSLQQEELRLTREEAKRSADAQELSQQSLSEQVELSVLSAYLAATESMHEVRARQTTAQTGYEGEINKVRGMLGKRLGSKLSKKIKEH